MEVKYLMDNCALCGKACEGYSAVKFWRINRKYKEFNFHPICLDGLNKIIKVINSQGENWLTEDEAAQIASSLFESEEYYE